MTERQRNKILTSVTHSLKKHNLAQIRTSIEYSSIRLEGCVSSINEYMLAGKIAVKQKTKGVINDITVDGMETPVMSMPIVQDSLLEGTCVDVLIVGAGVIGCAIARELARYDLTIAVVDKESDMAMHASGRNDGMIHPGFADNPKKIKGRYNTRGNRMYDTAAKELKFDIARPGNFMLFNTPLLHLVVPYLKYRCKKNGVDGKYRSMSREEVQKMDSELNPIHYGGFWLPSAGIASPFKVTTAYAENAAQNGVSFFFDTAVTAMQVKDKKITHIMTNRGTLSSEIVINAAGVWADTVAGFAGDRFFSIHARKGTDAILDKKCGKFQRTIVALPDLFATTKQHSKGGGLVPCIEGNLLLGPTAKEIMNREDFSTDKSDIAQLYTHLALNRRLKPSDIITYYSGVRAATWEEDFIIEASQRLDNFIHAAGIQSPGFASAPAIAQDIVILTVAALEKNRGKVVVRNEAFNPIRNTFPDLTHMSDAEKNELIRKDPAYGKIVCRCERISEGEIRDVLHSTIPVYTVDAIKRRLRAGAGRCHGGFCLPRVMEIISRETGIPLERITKKGQGSYILTQSMETQGAVDE